MWIIDFPPGMSESEAAFYEAPFEYAKERAKDVHEAKGVHKESRRHTYATSWWIHGRPRPVMRHALIGLQRYLATPRVTKHRLFAWLPTRVLPDSALIAFAREDDYFFGVMHSRVHELWARGTGTQLREAASGFRYTPSSCFDTFPFPMPSAEQEETIAVAAKELNELRETWLNPKGLVSDKDLKKRTLTNLYNERPTWLDNAHRQLDRAVLAAYGWPKDMDDAELLKNLLGLNLEREPAGAS